MATADLKQQRATALQVATNIIAKAKAQDRDLTRSEVTAVQAQHTTVEDLDRQIKGSALVDSVLSLGSADDSYIGRGDNLRMAMTGRAAKGVAAAIAERITRSDGPNRKALVTGTITLDPASTVEQSVDPLVIPRLPASILEVLPLVQRQSPQYSYLRQTLRTNNAAIVAPGATKPASIYSAAPVFNSLKVFAHISEPIDTYLLEDNLALQAFLQAEMIHGLTEAVESEVIAGAGTAGHLTGFLNTSGIQVQAAGADAITTLRSAATSLETAGFNPAVFLLNPLDWAAIETSRNTSGAFDLGGPVDRADRKVWGSQVVLSNKITTGTAAAIDTSALAVDTDTSGIKVAVSDAVADDFAKNQVRVRVEGRWSVSVYQPTGIVKITLPTG